MSNNKQPSEAREAANGAYLLRVSNQSDLVNFANSRDADPERVKWLFDRYWRSVERERQLEELAKAEDATKQ